MPPVLIMTRPAPQAAAFADAVMARWAGELRVIQSPLLVIQPVPIGQDLTTISGLILTSGHGVAAAVAAALPRGLPAYCVGEQTAQAAAKAGFDAITGPGDAARLVDKIIGRRPAGILAHVRGRHTRGDVSARLVAAGIACVDVIAYDQTAQPLSAEALAALHGADPVILPLFSPRTATILAEQGPFTAPVHLIVISNAVQSAAVVSVKSLSVAANPDAAAMLDATITRLRAVAQPTL
jgi:uroporphyrinogen-III synthase